MKSEKDSLFTRDGVSFVLPFVLVTSCFALWGFANNITHPMVESFSKIFRMSVTDGSLIQFAFYGGYFAMAFPAAMFIQKYSYKAGVLMGLGLYSIGAFLFYPAMLSGIYYPFLLAYFVLTCGLSFLETSCNPYVMAMGSEATATRRLNFAQCLNPVGNILGMYVAMEFIQSRMNPMSASERALLGDEEFELIKQSDLQVLINPYVAIGVGIAIMFFFILFSKIPRIGDTSNKMSVRASLSRLMGMAHYREGLVAQFFYVGVQTMCWTFIIQYGQGILTGSMPTGFESMVLTFMGYDPSSLITEQTASVLAQGYNIIAMIFFICARFVGTYLLKYIDASKILAILAVLGMVFVCVVVGSTSRLGLYALVGVSMCMSIMFPTIYGIALQGVGEDAKFGAAGLIMSILGGSILPTFQALMMDGDSLLGLPAVNASFVWPFICFLVIAVYAYRRFNDTKL